MEHESSWGLEDSQETLVTRAGFNVPARSLVSGIGVGGAREERATWSFAFK